MDKITFSNLKKIFLLYFVLLLMFSLFAACSENENNQIDENGIIKNYGGDMSLNAFVCQNKDERIAAACEYNSQDYFYFYLGKIDKVPVFTSYSKKFDGAFNKINFIFEECTQETMSTYLGATRNIVNEKNSYGIKLYNISDSEEEALIGSNGILSEHVVLACNILTHNNKTTDFITGVSGPKQISLTMKRDAFKKDNYYRISGMATVDLYGVLVFEENGLENNFGKWKYYYQPFISDSSELELYLEESEKGGFNYKYIKDLEFDIDKAIETAQDLHAYSPVAVNGSELFGYKVYNDITKTPNLMCDNEKYIINWSGEQTSFDYAKGEGWKSGLNNENFDIQQGVKEVYFIGDPRKSYTGLTIYFDGSESEIIDKGRDIVLHFENFNIKSRKRYPGISSWNKETNTESDYGQNVTIEVVGSNSIIADSSGANAIQNLSDLTIIGEGSLTVSAANGDGGASAGAKGGDGGVGIKAKNVTVDISGVFTVRGGDGGNGTTGASGSDGYNISLKTAGPAGEGSIGGNGGSGGRAIVAVSEIKLISGTVVLLGGNGGSGGNGGTGGKGADAKGGLSSGSGARGGNGGNGGLGNKAVSSGAKINTTNKVNYLAINGNGGDGGNGGAGGIAGKATIFGKTSSGNGGNGGAGGSGNIPGKGGSGGSAGSIPNNHSRYGSNGNPGSAGSVNFYDGDRTLILEDGLIVYGYNNVSSKCFFDGNFDSIYSVYDNNNAGAKITKVNSLDDNPLQFPYYMHVISKLNSSTSDTWNHMGGYVSKSHITAKDNTDYYYTVYAKVPIGYRLEMCDNIGENDNVKRYWLTDNEGTNEWRWYVGVTSVGDTGLAKEISRRIGFVALKECEDCPTKGKNDVVWRVAYSNVAEYIAPTSTNTEIS